MRSARSLVVAPLAVCALGLVSCSSEERVTRDLPYEGEAWPETRPSWTIPKSSLAVVTNNASDTISLLDLAANAVVATAPIDLDPLANDGPHHAAIDASGEHLYAPLAYPAPTGDLGPHAQHGASQIPGVLVKLRVRDLARVGEVGLDTNPGDVMLTPDGSRVIVTHFDLARAINGLGIGRPLPELRSAVTIVDAATMTKLAAPRPCVAAHGMATSKDGKKLYLACYGEDAIGVLDLDDPAKPAELWPLGPAPSVPPDISFGPYFVTLAPSGDALIVSETEGKSLNVVDLATKKSIARVPLDGAVFGPASTADGAIWLVAVQGPDKLVAIDGATWTPIKSRSFTKAECEKPHQVVRHGARWFGGCEGDHGAPGRVLEVDPSTLDTVRAFEVGAYPDVLAVPLGEGA